jgi:hypothetical protein
MASQYATQELSDQDDTEMDKSDDSDDDTTSSVVSFDEKSSSSINRNDKEVIDELCKQVNEIDFDGEIFIPPPIYTGTLEDLTLPELCEKLKIVYDRWFGTEARKLKNFYALSHYVFGLSINGNYNEEMIDKIYSRLHLELIQLNLKFTHMGVTDSDSSIGADYQRKFYRLHEALYNSRVMLSSAARGENSRDSKKCNAAPEKFDLFRFQQFDSGELDSFEELVIFIEHKAAEKGFRKEREFFYKEKITKCDEEDEKGVKKTVQYPTSFFEEECSIKQFAYRECSPETNFKMWRNLNKGNNLDKLVKIISENAENKYIPDLKRDRSISSWRNGLWFFEYAAFYPFKRGRLPKDIVASNFIDQDFDNTDYGDDFMKIPCVIKKILADQGYDELEQSCVLGIGLGRLIPTPGKFERWEILPYLWGLAGTGKSSIIDACIRLFSERDVQGVGSSFEKTFGLQDWIGKYLVAIQDITVNFPMDPADVKTITSLELMSTAIKYKNAQSGRWATSVIIAGNLFPKLWKDSLGALKRRIFLMDFPNHVVRDNQVKMDLENQQSLFYRIITYAYHYWCRECGRENIWPRLPRRFHDASKIISEHENPVEMFLNSPEIEYTKNEDDFLTEGYIRTFFKNWCTNWGHRVSLQPSELQQVMKNRGVRVEYCEREMKEDNLSSSSGDTGSGVPKKKKTITCHHYFGIKVNPKMSSNASGVKGGNFGTNMRVAK